MKTTEKNAASQVSHSHTPQRASSARPTTDPSSTRRIASLIGYHGFENAGDDAFCLVLGNWAGQLLDIDELQVSGADNKKPRTDFKEGITITGVEPEQRGGRIRRFLREPTYLIGKDLVIFGGGSIFSSRRFWWLAVQLWVLRLLRRFGLVDTVVAAVGISIGPFTRRGDTFWCRHALRQFDVITVRDQKSWEIGAAYGLQNLIPSYDLALAMPKFFQIPMHNLYRSKSDDAVIGFSVVDRDTSLGRSDVDDAKRKAMIESMVGVARRNPAVRFRGFNFCKNRNQGDYEATEKVTTALRAAGCQVEFFEYDNDPQSLLDAIGDVDVMICNRMHSFVFSCLTQTPAVMISYAQKMNEYAKLLEVPEQFQFSHSNLKYQRLTQTLQSLLDVPKPPCDPQVLSECTSNLVVDLELAAAMLRQHSYRARKCTTQQSSLRFLRRLQRSHGATATD